MIRWKALVDLDGKPTGSFEFGFGRWRSRVWHANGIWNWETRRFGRGELHVSGECASVKHAKAIAVAAARAIEATR